MATSILRNPVALPPERVKVGDIFRYHSITTSESSVPVRIKEAPWQLGDGSWICKAENLWTGAIVRPSLDALSIGETRFGLL